MDPDALSVLALLSGIVTCDDCCPAHRAAAAALTLHAEIVTCDHCGHPTWPALGPCRCLSHLGTPPNPSSERWKDLAREDRRLPVVVSGESG